MMRPAWIATLSGSKAERPRAMTSALTKCSMPRRPCSNPGAAVELPAPFGPGDDDDVWHRRPNLNPERHHGLAPPASLTFAR